MIFGVEIEYGVAPEYDHGRLVLPLALPTRDGGLHQGAFLPNGGKLYWDCGHPEYATPECETPRELVAHVAAGRGLVVGALAGGRDRRPPHAAKPVLFRHSFWPGTPMAVVSSDGPWKFPDIPAAWACHENYEVPDSWRHEIATARQLNAMRAFALSREAWSGAGGLSWGRDADGCPWSERPSMTECSQCLDHLQRIDRPRLFFSRSPRLHHVFLTTDCVLTKASASDGDRLQLKTPDIPLSSGVLMTRALVTSRVVGMVAAMGQDGLRSVPGLGRFLAMPSHDMALQWQERFAEALAAVGDDEASAALRLAIAAARDEDPARCDWAAKRKILAGAGLLEPHGGGWVVPRGLEAEALEADAVLGAVDGAGRSPWDDIEQDPVVTAEEVAAAARLAPSNPRAQARARLVRDLGFSSDEPFWREDGLSVSAEWGAWQAMYMLRDRSTGEEACHCQVFDMTVPGRDGVRMAKDKLLAAFPRVAEDPAAWTREHACRKGRPVPGEGSPRSPAPPPMAPTAAGRW